MTEDPAPSRRTRHRGSPQTYCMVIPVLPQYRDNFLTELTALAPGRILWLAGTEHFDPSVRAGVAPDLYRQTDNLFLMGRRLLVQRGTFRPATSAGVTVVDLNPRSLTAWSILLVRSALRRRTLTWGHLYPRAGRQARTSGLRAVMRRLGDGMITYTVRERDELLAEEPGTDVWVAPNALYPDAALAGQAPPGARTTILYVGRLETPKRPELLVAGFAAALPRLPTTARLVMVGEGTVRAALEEQAVRLGVGSRVDFVGHCTDLPALRTLYARAAVSVSPGYVGLALTQSLGFGVPMVVADDEPHAPEVELATEQAVTWFRARSVTDLADRLVEAFADPPDRAHSDHLIALVREHYTADGMARGFLAALENRPADGTAALSRPVEPGRRQRSDRPGRQ